MESKNKKLAKKEEIHDLDRLSCLPDSILTHILSFLDTKFVIRTSVLSKRYKLLWTLTPCLDFKLSEYHGESSNSFDGRVFTKGKNFNVTSFESYVYHVLEFREHSNLVWFRLSLHRNVPLVFIRDCIDYAARHKVQHLRFRGFFECKHLHYCNPVVALPELLLTSSSLITLHLHNATKNCIGLPKSAALPNLKVLRLKRFEFSDKNFNGELFLGCPSLETLVLSKCCIKPVNNGLKILEVNCLNLKNLEIKYWRSPWKCFDEHMIRVNAPKLVFFKFQGHLVRVNFKECLPVLEIACIDLRCPTACVVVNASERKQRTSESFLNMLRYIRSVRFLSLSLKTIEVVCVLPDLKTCASVTFENLKILKFTAENKYEEKLVLIETVARLLEKIDSDVLVLDGSEEDEALLECSNVKAQKDAGQNHIYIPANVMRFLLESSPAAELLVIEIPNVSKESVENSREVNIL